MTMIKHALPSSWGYRLVVAGGIVLAGLVLAMTGRAAPGPDIPTAPAIPVQADPNAPNVATAPQPIAIQALDATHFVVVTREPRLVQRVNGDGRFVNMVLPVVTHYTVQSGHLSPIEHVHVPEGWRPLAPAP
jgi:hypothetical protein